MPRDDSEKSNAPCCTDIICDGPFSIINQLFFSIFIHLLLWTELVRGWLGWEEEASQMKSTHSSNATCMLIILHSVMIHCNAMQCIGAECMEMRHNWPVIKYRRTIECVAQWKAEVGVSWVRAGVPDEFHAGCCTIAIFLYTLGRYRTILHWFCTQE